MRLAVIGATGTTGRHIVTEAAGRGHEVRALVRDPAAAAAFGPEVEIRAADILSGELAPALDGCDAVLSAVGVGLSPARLVSPPPLHTEGTRTILAAMRAADVRRLVVISAAFVAAQDRGPMPFRLAAIGLDRIFTQMGEMEQILRMAPDIDWTAVRPGWLQEGPATDAPVVTPDQLAAGILRTRHADLSRFMVSCVEDPAWIRRTPAIGHAEDAPAEQPSID